MFRCAPLMLVEGEIDAISIIQEAQTLITVVATGSAQNGRLNMWLAKLALAPHVFVAFDAEPKGEEGSAYWLRTLLNASRWRTSIGKDANDMLVKGGDIKLWVQAALSTLEAV
jgi:hypothetical protein